MGRQHQEMDMPGVHQDPEGNGEQGKMEKISCKIICGAPTTLAVKGLMLIVMQDPAFCIPSKNLSNDSFTSTSTKESCSTNDDWAQNFSQLTNKLHG